jgi:hypothetical protein
MPRHVTSHHIAHTTPTRRAETCFLHKGDRNLPGWYVIVRGSVISGFGDQGGDGGLERGCRGVGWCVRVCVCVCGG